MPSALAPAGPARSLWDGFPLGGDPGSTPVAVGGDLDPGTLVGAYRRGVFPWPPDGPAAAQEHARRFGAAVAAGEIPTLPASRAAARRPPRCGQDPLGLPWWSPDPRGVIPVDAVQVPRTLCAKLRNAGWTTTLDHDFAAVLDGCRFARPTTWITPALAAAYRRLHDLGWAHSVEVWSGDGQLAGGVYGVLIGGVFMAESSFFTRSNGSKAAVVDLAARLREGGGLLLDAQFASSHLVPLGAVTLPRARFLALLGEARDARVRLPAGRLPAARLAPR